MMNYIERNKAKRELRECQERIEELSKERDWRPSRIKEIAELQRKAQEADTTLRLDRQEIR